RGDDRQRFAPQHRVPRQGLGEESPPPTEMRRVEAGQRVVEQQQPRPQRQTAAQRDPPGPGTAQRGGASRQQRSQLEVPDQGLQRGQGLGGSLVPVIAPGQQEVLRHAEAGEESAIAVEDE
ncbi:MAG: hypothetical protein ACK559_35680, partial [bacterium]